MELPPVLHHHPDGEIRLVGHRISLYDVINAYGLGFPAEALVFRFDTLSLRQIEQVIEFYHANEAEVDEYVEAYRAELQRQYEEARAAGHAHTVEELMERFRARQRSGDAEATARGLVSVGA